VRTTGLRGYFLSKKEFSSLEQKWTREHKVAGREGNAMGEIRVRSGRDDKVEGGGQPLHEWRWMDRVKS
jgi:hypothetical protein